ncbi:MAG: ATP-dependent DNA ligase [Acidobacteria bacterium]|nr:ATP-dependent DNA ligase [Acidobacteriota bacterium]
MLLAAVVDTSRRMSETSKRLEKIGLLATLLGSLEGEEIDVVVAFLSGRTRQGKIGIGWRTLQEVMTGATPGPSLTIREVDDGFAMLAGMEGPGSERRRVEFARQLMSRATEAEQQFLLKLVVGELRQGALEGIMADAVAKAAGLPAERVRLAARNAGDIADVARAALERGEGGLDAYDVRLFRPIQPMLAQTAEDVDDALEDLGEAALEFKMDGARVQAHRSGDEVRIYTRNRNDVTAAVPEVVEAVRALPVREAILDGEAISLQGDGRPQPFQVTMRRFGRKLDVERLRAELPIQPFWFDVLYLDGGPLVDEAQRRRFEALSRVAPPETLIPAMVTADRERARGFVEEAFRRGHEGVMAKSLEAGYLVGARGQSWLKVKRAKTLDLVILAAEWGSGRREGWLSNLHLGARDVVKGGFAMLGKTFKGLTDEMLAWQTQELLKREVARDAYTVHVEPSLVAEIAYNDLQVSPRYASGYALRFARVKRYRTDKTAAEADTFQSILAREAVPGGYPEEGPTT